MAFAALNTQFDAAYGGIYIATAILWLFVVKDRTPDRRDLLGTALSVAGAVAMLLGRCRSFGEAKPLSIRQFLVGVERSGHRQDECLANGVGSTGLDVLQPTVDLFVRKPAFRQKAY